MPHLPEQLLNSLRELEVDVSAFSGAHENEGRITSIRLNPFKKTRLDFPVNTKVPWCRDGYYIDERPSFTHDPLFHAGCYYVQEAGSMFIEHALRSTLNLDQPLKILDLCGAPGGKSTLINSILNPDSLLVANEIIKGRADLLSYNLSKWGTCNTIVTNNDPTRLGELTGFFDAIVVDAPCSGSGLFRKQPEAISEWSVSHVKACSVRQRQILADVLPALAENGILIYSTCSYSSEENEEVVKWLVGECGLQYESLPLQKEWGITEGKWGCRFYPHLVMSEGFFCAALRKVSGYQTPGFQKGRPPVFASETQKELFGEYLPKDADVIKINEQFHLVNEKIVAFLGMSNKPFYLKKAGIVIGEIKGKNVVPNHELALGINLPESFSKADLSLDQAVRYLKKESFTGWENSAGVLLLTYKNRGIGWGKALQNRMNNYLPNNLRILK